VVPHFKTYATYASYALTQFIRYDLLRPILYKYQQNKLYFMENFKINFCYFIKFEFLDKFNLFYFSGFFPFWNDLWPILDIKIFLVLATLLPFSLAFGRFHFNRVYQEFLQTTLFLSLANMSSHLETTNSLCVSHLIFVFGHFCRSQLFFDRSR
jgi:hypothetical protein